MGVQFMSSRSAVNQEHRPVSAAPDCITFDLHSLCDLLTSVKRAKEKQTIWQPYGRRCAAENDEVLWPGASLNQGQRAKCQQSLYELGKVLVVTRTSWAYIATPNTSDEQ